MASRTGKAAEELIHGKMNTNYGTGLGARLIDDGVRFALYSSVAERIELCLFTKRGVEEQRIDMQAGGNDGWELFVPKLNAGQRYGYRVHGPFDPRQGLYCNPEKLLIDPYARLLHGDFHWHDSVFGHQHGDSSAHVPKSVVLDKVLSARERPSVPWGETVFYEANVGGYTMRHPDVPKSKRGRFAGMKNKHVLSYLKALGVTSVELLPVFAYIDEHHLVDRGLRNFWGYNSINFFAPANRYAGKHPVREFRDMVDAIHDAGLEVILDVAYNHTGEGDQNGPTLSLRGLDNHAYYRMEPGDAGHYVNDTGCGNTINADHPIVQQLVLDSLRYWAGDLGVDGFRFDLASILGRHASGFSSEHPLLNAIGTDPLLSQLKIVAEPWDPGPGGYQVGQFPAPWAEWNDKFRDTARRFWRGDAEQSGEMARRFHGSAELYEHSGRPPHASVNKITSHDGFTLVDLVSYEHRHNEANGEDNRDGHAHNYSSNHGTEGPSDDPDTLAARRQHRLNLLATLMLSQGTPLLLAGDEFGNSQGGNNNAYAQDNEIGWLDWSGLVSDPGFAESVRHLVGLRNRYPVLRLDRYVHGELDRDGAVIRLDWVNPDGERRKEEDWNFGHAFGALYETSSPEGKAESVAVLFNAWDGELNFTLPETAANHSWQLEFLSTQDSRGISDRCIGLPGRSIAVAVTARTNQQKN